VEGLIDALSGVLSGRYALDDLVRWGGYVVLVAIVFVETGLLIGFFLPGDSLLFMAGFLSSEAGGHVLPSLPITALVVFVSAVDRSQAIPPGRNTIRHLGPPVASRAIDSPPPRSPATKP